MTCIVGYVGNGKVYIYFDHLSCHPPCVTNVTHLHILIKYTYTKCGGIYEQDLDNGNKDSIFWNIFILDADWQTFYMAGFIWIKPYIGFVFWQNILWFYVSY